MATTLVRYRDRGDPTARWAAVVDGDARPLAEPYATTADVLAAFGATASDASTVTSTTEPLSTAPPRPLAELTLLSPVTAPCRVIAQAMNYADHARETGSATTDRPNILFRKASASIGGPHDPVTRPAHVTLLDHEVELGLVIGRAIRRPLAPDGETLPATDLHHYIGALVVTNDLSARDVQVPEGQFYKGKSYPGFTPVGPYLVIPTPAELDRWPELRLTLRVDDQPRQEGTCGQMIHPPAATLTELSRFQHLDPGDLILTGTPAGVALDPPGGFVRAIAGFLPEATRWRLFTKGQQKRPGYLAPGQTVTATIRTDDGALDLGEQRFAIR